MKDIQKGGRLICEEIDEGFFDKAIDSIGGKRISEIVQVPDGFKNCDYLFLNYLLELKFIEKEFFDNTERNRRLYNLLIKVRDETGKDTIRISRNLLDEDTYNRYWDIYFGALKPIIRKTNKQIEDTKRLLEIEGKGVLLLINKECDSVNHHDLHNYVDAYVNRKYPSVEIVMTLTLIPHQTDQYDRPVIPFSVSQSVSDKEMVELENIQSSILKQLQSRLGKSVESINSLPLDLRPIRPEIKFESDSVKVRIDGTI